MSLENRVSGFHPLKEPGYPSLAVCLATSAIRSALQRNGPMTTAELSGFLRVTPQTIAAALPWMRRWGWVRQDGDRLTLLTPADTNMRGA